MAHEKLAAKNEELADKDGELVENYAQLEMAHAKLAAKDEELAGKDAVIKDLKCKTHHAPNGHPNADRTIESPRWGSHCRNAMDRIRELESHLRLSEKEREDQDHLIQKLRKKLRRVLQDTAG